MPLGPVPAAPPVEVPGLLPLVPLPVPVPVVPVPVVPLPIPVEPVVPVVPVPVVPLPVPVVPVSVEPLPVEGEPMLPLPVLPVPVFESVGIVPGVLPVEDPDVELPEVVPPTLPPGTAPVVPSPGCVPGELVPVVDEPLRLLPVVVGPPMVPVPCVPVSVFPVPALSVPGEPVVGVEPVLLEPVDCAKAAPVISSEPAAKMLPSFIPIPISLSPLGVNAGEKLVTVSVVASVPVRSRWATGRRLDKPYGDLSTARSRTGLYGAEERRGDAPVIVRVASERLSRSDATVWRREGL